MSKPKERPLFCYFKPQFLWCLQPFVDWQRDSGELRFLDGTVFVEPAPFSGVFIGCVMGTAMAVFHDPDGYASAAMTLDMPDEVFPVCGSPAPIAMDYCGGQYSLDLPEWARPGRVYAYEAGLHVQPKMRHPQWADHQDEEFHPSLYSITASVGCHYVRRDYRAKAGLPADWRRPLEISRESSASGSEHHTFSPGIVNLFSRVHELCAEDSPDGTLPRMFHRPSGPGEAPGATLVTFEGRPDFVGCYMPMKQSEPQPVSDFFFQKMPAAH